MALSGTFVESLVNFVDVNTVKKAEYNPRFLSEESFENLKQSVKKLGFLIPVIVNKQNNVLIAGHQRSKTAKALGIEKIPAFFVENIEQNDEINFNLLHNSVDSLTALNYQYTGEIPQKTIFYKIENKNFTGNRDNLNAEVVRNICSLINRYGNVFSTIVCKNKTIIFDEYVYSCKLLNLPVNTIFICDSNFENLIKFFKLNYGKYDYSNIEKKTFVQGLAQLNRKKCGFSRSILYEEHVFKYLKENDIKSVLDFGCGKGLYINELKKKYNAIGIEFFPHNTKSIDVKKGNKSIDDLLNYLKTKKTFDLVVCDSVLNSVDSPEAETNVMCCLNIFCEKYCFVSGRYKGYSDVKYKKSTISATKGVKNKLYYSDELGFCANFRQGQWFFQKFHNDEQLKDLFNKTGFKIVKKSVHSGNFKILLEKTRELSKEEKIKAIDFEFNLPLPNNKTYNRHNDIKKALNLC